MPKPRSSKRDANEKPPSPKYRSPSPALRGRGQANHPQFRNSKGWQYMALRVKAENVPVKKVVLSADQGQGSMVVKQAYGNESSLMMATRPPGYHTKPHMHVSEQINHVL